MKKISIIIKNKLFLGVFAKFMSVACGILTLPLIVHYLNKEQITIYFLFVSFSLLAVIIDCGFNPTLTRYFSYIYSGVQEIKNDASEYVNGGHTNFELLNELYLVSRRIYLFLSIIAMVIFYLFGSLYLFFMLGRNSGTLYYLVCWLFYSSASVVNLYYLYITPLIQARGDIHLTYKAIIFSRLITLLLNLLSLLSGFMLLGLSITTVIGAISERYLLYMYLNLKLDGLQNGRIIDFSMFKDYFKMIWNSSYKVAIVSIGGYLSFRCDIFLASHYIGVTKSADYVFTLQCLTILYSVCTVFISVYFPRLSYYFINDQSAMRELYCFINVLTLVSFLIGASFILFFGNFVLTGISSKVYLLPHEQLVFLLTNFLLETLYFNSLMMISITNKIPFVKSSLVTGISLFLFSLLSLKYTNFGVWGLILCRFIIPLIFNHWYWHYYIRNKLNISYTTFFKIDYKNVFSL